MFDGISLSMAATLVLDGEERWLWEMAGAIGISFLTTPLPEDKLVFRCRSFFICKKA